MKDDLNVKLRDISSYIGNEIYDKLHENISCALASNTIFSLAKYDKRRELAPWVDEKLAKLIERKKKAFEKVQKKSK